MLSRIDYLNYPNVIHVIQKRWISYQSYPEDMDNLSTSYKDVDMISVVS